MVLKVDAVYHFSTQIQPAFSVSASSFILNILALFPQMAEEEALHDKSALPCHTMPPLTSYYKLTR